MWPFSAVVSRDQDYQLLSTADSREADSINDEVHFLGKRTDERTARSYASLICSSITVANLILLIMIYWDAPREYGRASLPRPNQYIGLETIERTKEQLNAIEPLRNYPPLLHQIDHTRPDYTFPTDTRRVFTQSGTVSLEDRHLLINSSVSTIMQTRARDFGMEDCQIVMNVPPYFESLHAGFTGASHVRPSRALIEVWRLNSITPLSTSTLSARNRPRRQELLATLEISIGEEIRTSLFKCPSDTLQTFEFACAAGDVGTSSCAVEFWQNRRSSGNKGVFLLQHATS